MADIPKIQQKIKLIEEYQADIKNNLNNNNDKFYEINKRLDSYKKLLYNSHEEINVIKKKQNLIQNIVDNK